MSIAPTYGPLIRPTLGVEGRSGLPWEPEQGGAPWTPSADAGLVRWWRADQGVSLSGSDVTAWADIVSGISLTASGNPQVTAAIDGQATIAFDGTGDWLRNASIASLAQRYIVYLVGQITGAAATQILCDDGGGNSDAPAIFFASSLWQANSGGSSLTSGSPSKTAAHAHCLDANGASSAYYVDDLTSAIASGNAGATASNSLTIGANQSGAGPLTGVIAEVIFTTTPDRSQIGAYLAARYPSIGVTA